MFSSERSGGCDEVGDCPEALAIASLPLIVATRKCQLHPIQKNHVDTYFGTNGLAQQARHPSHCLHRWNDRTAQMT